MKAAWFDCHSGISGDMTLGALLDAGVPIDVIRSAVQSVLPSITMCGMAALLPHKTYELTPDYRLLVDGKPCASTNERAKIISSYKPNSLCIQFDALNIVGVDIPHVTP